MKILFDDKAGKMPKIAADIHNIFYLFNYKDVPYSIIYLIIGKYDFIADFTAGLYVAKTDRSGRNCTTMRIYSPECIPSPDP